ncbi:MAG: purine-nucleoside phosphorylase [Anaerolineaceae bacterium]|nr:purine-nucleoside phosphorylase [Anaerolineaceae bacterium]
MTEFLSYHEIDAATDAVRARLTTEPQIALILGSGLGELAESIENPVIIPTHEIPFWPQSTVPGHKGRLVIGELEGKQVLVLQGRTHYYEGHSVSKIGLPIRVMQRLGIKTLILTNASGGLHDDFYPGDIMLIKDHLALLPMAGENPLRGPNLDEFGPRFPDMSAIYNPELIELAEDVASGLGLKLHQGVYVCLSGPSFETPADCRFLKMVGVDAVGMSTVPEAIVAKHGGMDILGFATITNKIDPDGTNKASHEEVLEVGDQLAPNLMKIIRGVLRRL